MLADWDQLRYVLAVAREGSLSAAARVLGVNQGTVSRQLARAEETSGQRLFDRTPGGMTPTSAGFAAIDAAGEVERIHRVLTTELERNSDSVAGVLRITTPRSILPYGFADLLAAFQAEHPEVTLDITSSDRLRNLPERAADVAIRAQNAPSPGLWGPRLATMTYAYWGSADAYARVGGASPHWDVALPFIDASGSRRSDPAPLLAAYPNAVRMASCNGLEAMIPLLRAGIGFGQLPRFVARAHPDLRELTAAPVERTLSLWALTHPDLRKTPRIRSFIDFLASREEIWR